jgi:hypothetical protein
VKRRLRSGSRASRIVEVATSLCEQLGRGAEVAELRHAYEGRTGQPPPRSFTSEIHSLVRRGVLERTGGRAGHTLYAPAGSGLGGRDSDQDDAFIVLKALRSAYKRAGRAVSTSEVRAEVRRLGLKLSSSNINTIGKRLETLARRRTRGARSMRPPQVIRIHAESTAGQPSAHWVPADVVGEVTVAPRSRADALRRAVFAGSLDLFRPVSRRELRWWLSTPAADQTLRGLIATHNISGELGRLARHDAAHAWDPGRVHTVRTAFTCHGGGDPRYLLGPPAPIDIALCRIEDALLLLRPADELHGIQVLKRRAQVARSEVLAVLATVREDLLASLVHGVLGDFPDRRHLMHRARLAGTALRRWVEQTQRLTPDQRDKRLQTLGDRDYQLSALAKLANRPSPGPEPVCLRIGEAGVVDYAEIKPVVERAAELLDIPLRSAHTLIQAARRVPVDRLPASRFGNANERPLARLDRVDVLTALWELFSVPRARSLLLNAQFALGYVLRDGLLLESLLPHVPRRAPDERRTLVVALGLLGTVLGYAEAGLDRSGADDAAAWALAVILARGFGAEEVLAAEKRSLAGPARQVVDEALMRVSARYPFSAIR